MLKKAKCTVGKNPLCKRCLYTTVVPGNKYGCGYCLLTGRMRACEISSCDKFEKMDKKQRAELEKDMRKIGIMKAQGEYAHYIGDITSKKVEK